MKLHKSGKILSALLALILFVACFPVSAMANNWNVKTSKSDYSVSIGKMSGGVFISNKETIGSAVGTEYYMTYTVASSSINKKPIQQGVVGTTDPNIFYPYGTGVKGHGGVMYWEPSDLLLEHGKTYFLKFTITEDGFTYRVGWAKDENSRYIKFSQPVKHETTGLTHFGIWLEAYEFEAELTHVHCYDKKGNDLGVRAGRDESIVYVNSPMPKDTKVPHKFDIKVTDQVIMAMSNRFKPSSDKIYFQYYVKSSSKTHLEQVGISLSNAPYAGFPYTSGVYYYNQYSRDIDKMDCGPLLEEGASYIICCEKKKDRVAIRTEKTKNGKTTLIDFGLTSGNFYSDQFFYSIFFCGIADHPNSFEILDFKCYDSNGKNLGLICNQPADITHYGEYEDAEGLDGVYYDKKNEVRLDLNPDSSAVLTQNGEKKKGHFSIDDNFVLTLNINGSKQEYDYFYNYISNDNARFDRLKNYKITFDTGKGSKIDVQKIGREQDYQASRPKNPTLKGTKFVCWCTSDGKEYKFDKIVTESLTLYAKWSDTNYTVLDYATKASSVLSWLAFVAGTIVLLAGVTTAVIIIRKEKKHANGKE